MNGTGSAFIVKSSAGSVFVAASLAARECRRSVTFICFLNDLKSFNTSFIIMKLQLTLTDCYEPSTSHNNRAVQLQSGAHGVVPHSDSRRRCCFTLILLTGLS
ncbi:hypothetical protein AMECASPLE_025419 [Ameca splendens]|uniref:Secreted protein n=1 Tax=Ameca splendens TaxID=208324 RepID=A0ABV0XTK4_9TELE